MPGELFVEYQLAAAGLKPEATVCMAAYGDYGPGYIGTQDRLFAGGLRNLLRLAGRPEVEKTLLDALAGMLPWPRPDGVFMATSLLFANRRIPPLQLRLTARTPSNGGNLPRLRAVRPPYLAFRLNLIEFSRHDHRRPFRQLFTSRDCIGSSPTIARRAPMSGSRSIATASAPPISLPPRPKTGLLGHWICQGADGWKSSLRRYRRAGRRRAVERSLRSRALRDDYRRACGNTPRWPAPNMAS